MLSLAVAVDNPLRADPVKLIQFIDCQPEDRRYIFDSEEFQGGNVRCK